MKIDYANLTGAQIEAAARADEREKIQKQLDAISLASVRMTGMIGLMRPEAARTAEPPAPKQPRAVKLDAGVVEVVLDSFKHMITPISIEKLFASAGHSSRKQYGNYLAALVRDGRIVKEGSGKNAKYRLNAGNDPKPAAPLMGINSAGLARHAAE